MLKALYLAFAQLSDPALRRVLKLGLLGAVASYVALVALVWFGLGAVAARLPTEGWEGWGILALVISGKVGTLVVPLLFFPALCTVSTSFFLDQVANAVEARHYPELNWPRPQKWAEVFGTTLTFLGVTVLANLAALPFYVALLFAGLTPVVYYALNGYLLGREFFDVVAYRRLDPAETRLLFRNCLGRVWLAGVVITLLFSIPILNLAAPVIATAFMAHLFQSLQRALPKL